MNIIADVAGRYNELMKLIKLMPDEEFIFVGDLVDRGSKSKEVVEWVMNNALCVLGNHEDMMIDWYKDSGRYENGIWEENGGLATMNSYGRKMLTSNYTYVFEKEWINPSHIKWMESLPIEIRTDGLLVTHAPFLANPINELDKIWNRDVPDYQEGWYNIFGHNSHWGVRKFQHVLEYQKVIDYAMCIDASSQKVLTGINWPSMKVFQVNYEEIS